MVLALEKQIHTAIQKSKVVSMGFTIELGQNNLIYSDVLIWDDKDLTQNVFFHIEADTSLEFYLNYIHITKLVKFQVRAYKIQYDCN